jgi:N-acetylglucosamine-6-phosphate deacetylase
VGEDGRTRLVGTDALAGSTLSMPKAITNVIKFTGIDLGTAIKMVTENGRKLFPGMIGTISPDQPANLVLFRFRKEVTIEKTILMGQEIQIDKHNVKYQSSKFKVQKNFKTKMTQKKF